MSSVQWLFALWKISKLYKKEKNSYFMKSLCIIVSGKVQGVFFRDSTRRKADELELAGYVKNLSNGTVEVVVQGTENKINELIKFIKNNPGHSKVSDVKINYKELEKLDVFEIKD